MYSEGRHFRPALISLSFELDGNFSMFMNNNDKSSNNLQFHHILTWFIHVHPETIACVYNDHLLCISKYQLWQPCLVQILFVEFFRILVADVRI